MPSSHRFSYSLLGAVISLGAPAGLLVVRVASGSAVSITDELFVNRLTYAYVLVASALAFAIFGYFIGRQTDALRTLATTDPLTGLMNRRAMTERLHDEYERAKRYGLPLSVLVIDLDGLKRVNDAGGHAAGDRAIRGAAAAIKQTLRATDSGGRWGGDEFMVIAPHSARESARMLAERVSVAIATRARADKLAATASIGVATFDHLDENASVKTPLSLVEEADRALYAAKHSGRSRVKAS
jgi:diguanylate cyclase (GGDEF)-like protein